MTRRPAVPTRLPAAHGPVPTAAPQAPTAWMQTMTGAAFPLIDPPPSAVDWRDVAAGLGRQARYNGHTEVIFYSVAEHSVRAWRHVTTVVGWSSEDARRIGGDRIFRDLVRREVLLHDAHEAYLGDWTSPVKEALGAVDPAATAALKRLEHGVAAAIHEKAGLPWPLHPSIAAAVKWIDLRMLATERRDLCARGVRDWCLTAPPLPTPIVKPMQPGAAEAAFLEALEAEGWMR